MILVCGISNVITSMHRYAINVQLTSYYELLRWRSRSRVCSYVSQVQLISVLWRSFTSQRASYYWSFLRDEKPTTKSKNRRTDVKNNCWLDLLHFLHKSLQIYACVSVSSTWLTVYGQYLLATMVDNSVEYENGAEREREKEELESTHDVSGANQLFRRLNQYKNYCVYVL